MLILTKFIGKGATRICFEHPHNPEKCVKVVVRFKESKLLKREIDTYYKIQSFMNDFLLKYEPRLVETNIGIGLVCELLKNDDGTYSMPLGEYLKENSLNEDLIHQLYMFACNLTRHQIFFYDFNLNNFMVQIKKGRPYLKYTDLKSYNRYKPLICLRLERLSDTLACHIMKRRLKRMFHKLGIE